GILSLSARLRARGGALRASGQAVAGRARPQLVLRGEQPLPRSPGLRGDREVRGAGEEVPAERLGGLGLLQRGTAPLHRWTVAGRGQGVRGLPEASLQRAQRRARELRARGGAPRRWTVRPGRGRAAAAAEQDEERVPRAASAPARGRRPAGGGQAERGGGDVPTCHRRATAVLRSAGGCGSAATAGGAGAAADRASAAGAAPGARAADAARQGGAPPRRGPRRGGRGAAAA